jgi:hypothetical protein
MQHIFSVGEQVSFMLESGRVVTGNFRGYNEDKTIVVVIDGVQWVLESTALSPAALPPPMA